MCLQGRPILFQLCAYSNVLTYHLSPQVERSLDDKASLAVVMFNVLLVDTARGIFFPTLWPRIELFGGNNVTLGYCVGAFSLGRYVRIYYKDSLEQWR